MFIHKNGNKSYFLDLVLLKLVKCAQVFTIFTKAQLHYMHSFALEQYTTFYIHIFISVLHPRLITVFENFFSIFYIYFLL